MMHLLGGRRKVPKNSRMEDVMYDVISLFHGKYLIVNYYMV